MSSWNIVLIDTTTGSVVPPGQLQAIAAAVQQQVDNDFAPVWGVRADISALAAGDAIPAGAWPVKVVNLGSLNPEDSGTHLDNQAQPYAQVVNSPDLSSVISHEVLEMLADPWGNRFVPGPDIDTSNAGREVFYLVEVCDPCENSKYPIDGVQVSDFVRPSFYDRNGVAPFDFLDTSAGPLKVPQGCYISWIDPVDWKWHRIITDGSIVTGDVTPSLNPREDHYKAFGDAVG
jgi:hypothetical protein